MTSSNQQQNELNGFIQQTEVYLDQVVGHGDDQALFIASYLQGHFAVAAGQSQVQAMTKVQQLAQLMQISLDSAFANSELEEEDQRQVSSLWQSLLNAKVGN